MAQGNQDQGGRSGEGDDSDRPRDENGRFTTEESSQNERGQDGGSEDGEGDGRGWHGDPEGHREAALKGGSQDRPRDEDGRFVSEDDEGEQGE